MIDLHTHTHASDGRLSPADLVACAARAGVTVLGVTDHDTVAGADAAAAACRSAGLEFVPGIEVTAARDDADVHVLGYFIDVHSAPLLDFLAQQRLRRIDRVRAIVARLAGLGMPLDADALVQPAIDDASKSAGRPWVARAMVAAGYAASIDVAFGRWLGRGRPAYVPRLAASPSEVTERLHAAGGLVSLAHPGLLRHDEWLPGLIDAGIDAIEAYHSEHDAAAASRYAELASRAGLLITGGSDFHGDNAHGAAAPGAATLPRDAWDALRLRMRHN
ncbi:MAG: PHP domain-containing protein [Acidobacteria bacterium]|nr:PHP domain-containing protein [Acidobacteriota bacterium]